MSTRGKPGTQGERASNARQQTTCLARREPFDGLVGYLVASLVVRGRAREHHRLVQAAQRELCGKQQPEQARLCGESDAGHAHLPYGGRGAELQAIGQHRKHAADGAGSATRWRKDRAHNSVRTERDGFGLDLGRSRALGLGGLLVRAVRAAAVARLNLASSSQRRHELIEESSGPQHHAARKLEQNTNARLKLRPHGSRPKLPTSSHPGRTKPAVTCVPSDKRLLHP